MKIKSLITSFSGALVSEDKRLIHGQIGVSVACRSIGQRVITISTPAALCYHIAVARYLALLLSVSLALSLGRHLLAAYTANP